MKTLKVVILLIVILAFSSNIVNAQATQGRFTFPTCWTLICEDELACGEMTHMWLNNDNIVKSYYTGKMIGQETGTVYLIKQLHKIKEVINKAEVSSFQADLMIHANGKLIGIIHTQSHITVNANGEVTAEIDLDPTVECK